MSECTNPKCRVILNDGRRICPECGTPVQVERAQTRKGEDIETMIRGDLNRKIPAGGNLPKKPRKGNEPLTFKQMLTVLIVSAVVFCVGFIPPAEEKLIESIHVKGSSALEMVEDDSKTVIFEINPDGFDADDVEVSLSDPDVVEVEKMTMSDEGDTSELNVELKALSPGTATLTVSAKDGDAESKPVTINVAKKIEVQSISAFSKNGVELETGENYSTTLTLKTDGLTNEDLRIESSDPNVLRIDSAELTDQDDESVLTLNLTAVSAGSAKLTVASAADASISRTLSVTVSDPAPEPETTAQAATDTSGGGTGTSSGGSGTTSSTTTNTGLLAGYTDEELAMTVYINRTGECYHYDPECASPKNPITTTLREALLKGKRACNTCVY